MASASTLEMLVMQADHAAKLIDALLAEIGKPEMRDLVTAGSIGRMEAHLQTAHAAVGAVRIALQANAKFNAERAAVKAVTRG